MRASEPGSAAEGFPAPPLWLLIGNSRWHWAGPDADAADGSLWLRHTAPWPAAIAPPSAAAAGAEPAAPLRQLRTWAAVGAVPAGLGLPEAQRLQLADVPLAGMPPWLGLDRALGGWWAWRLLRTPLLLADAGTVLSLTRVDGAGVFAGGRLLAGLALQLQAMARGTTALPWLGAEGATVAEADPWPQRTAAAMVRGVGSGLAAAVDAAFREACREEPDCRLVLTGGDAETLLPRLHADRERLLHRPALPLEAMAALRPA